MKNVRLVWTAALMLAALGVAAPRSDAAVITLSDDNSSLTLDPTLSTGMDDWFVDGTDHLFQQWLWYRIGASGPEASIDSLPLILSGTTDTDFDGFADTAYTKYQASDIRIEVTYTLQGGSPGSKSADLGELIKVTNLNPSAVMDFHLFEYTDFDLGIDPLNDTASMVAVNKVVQQDDAYFASETVSVNPSRFEVNTFPNTRNSLTDGGPTTLNNVASAGPDNVTWAFQWDSAIAPLGVFQVSKNKMIGVPEPASMLLFGTALIGAAGMARRRKAQARI